MNLPEYTCCSWTLAPYSTSGCGSTSSRASTASFFSRSTRVCASMSAISLPVSEFARLSLRLASVSLAS